MALRSISRLKGLRGVFPSTATGKFKELEGVGPRRMVSCGRWRSRGGQTRIAQQQRSRRFCLKLGIAT